jgi:hypothetical protein
VLNVLSTSYMAGETKGEYVSVAGELQCIALQAPALESIARIMGIPIGIHTSLTAPARTILFTELPFNRSYSAMRGFPTHGRQFLVRPLPLLVLVLLTFVGCSTGFEQSSNTKTRPIAMQFQIMGSPSEEASSHVEKLLAETASVVGAGRARPRNLQKVKTTVGKVWVFQLGSHLCLRPESMGASGCIPNRTAWHMGLAVGTFVPPKEGTKRLENFRVYGVVPDGVTHVVARIGRKRHRRLMVRHNVYAMQANVPIWIEPISQTAGPD